MLADMLLLKIFHLQKESQIEQTKTI